MDQETKMPTEYEKQLMAWLDRVVKANAQKNFVQRISDPGKWPTLDLGGGQSATHQMAWGTTDRGPVVYPTVVYDESTRGLKRLEAKAAFQHAMKTGEFIQMPDDRSADIFSKEYKRLWGPAK
jgi:hypothetical protein